MRNVLAIAAALAVAPTSGGHPAAAAAPPGPRLFPDEPGEIVAHDEAELGRMLSDPGGPPLVRLDARTYRGDWTIGRPVRLRGRPGTVLEGSGTGTVVTIAADGVAIEDVVVRGSGGKHTTEDAAVRATGRDVHVRRVLVDGTLFGIRYAQCAACSVEDSHVVGRDDVVGMRGDGIKVWESDDVVVRDTLVERSRDVVVWYSRRATVEGLAVTGSRYGTHFMYAHDGVVRRSRFEGDVVGVFVMYSGRIRVERSVLAGARGAAGMGIGFKESDDVVLDGDWIVANTAGLYFDRTPRSPEHPVLVQGDVLALNRVAMRLHSSEQGVVVRDCDFRENLQAAQVEGGGDALGMDVRGNHWTEYEGYDLDGDGRGDVPFQIKKLASDVKDAHPDLRLLDGSVAMGLVDAVAEATPMFASRLVLVDPSPRMRPPATEVPVP
jgi:nitrous oxidase accessory protein